MASFLRQVSRPAFGPLGWLLAWTLLALAPPGVLFGRDWKALQPQGYVSDFAGVVAPGQKQELEAFSARFQAETGVEMAFVLLPSLDGEPVEDVANTLFRAWGIGKKGKDNGLLLLLSVQDRKSRLEVGYGLEPVLPDGSAGDLLRAMRPALRANDYGDALALAAQQLSQRIRGDAATAAEAAPQPRRHAARSAKAFPLQGIIVLVFFVGGICIFAAMIFFAARRRHGGWGGPGVGGPGVGGPMIFMGGPSNSPWSSSGGFGGYDSSDSFGGFGGGDSGGGGASSDW